MRRLLPLLLCATVAVAACSSDSESGSAGSGSTTDASVLGTTEPPPVTTESPATTEAVATTEATTTTAPAAPEITPADLAAPGPYAVGVTTRALPEGNPVEVWYPADASTAGGTDTYNVRQFLPPAIGDLVPAEVDDTLTIDATRDGAAASDGPFPVVLFSHGSTSFRLQSSVLARHLASWGMVVASTDHPSRDLLNVIGGTAAGQRPAVDDMRSMRTYLTTIDADPVLGGVVDNDRVALGGHSAGGGTIVDLAVDQGILGYVSYASGLRDAAPAVPSLFLAGELDTIVPAAERTQPAFDAAASPSWLWVFSGAGHLAFSDLCAIGGGDATLVDLAEAAGLGALVDDRLRALATDGCEEPNRSVDAVWPGVHQASTGFYRWVFGIDPEPIGLDESVVTDGVTVTSK